MSKNMIQAVVSKSVVVVCGVSVGIPEQLR